ncbi:MAG TPA: DUF4397 domain-containing protein [Polyangiaceae bacterium]|nr:DUF4397 domain-containing protein [Polyangiaceae bacterium]
MKIRKSLCVGLSLSVAAAVASLACNDDDNPSTGNPGEGGAAGSGGAADASTGGTSGSGGGGVGGHGGVAGSADAGDAGGETTDGGEGPDGSAATAMIRIVHAATGAPAVDLYVKGDVTPLATGLAYGKASSYVTVPAGNPEIEVRAMGASPTSTPLYTTSAVQMEAGKKYTAVASGNVASTATTDAFRVLPLEEAFAAAGAGKTRVRVVHAGWDAPTVGLDVNADAPAAPEVPSLARFADTGTDGLELDTTTGYLQLGVDVNAEKVTSFTLPTLPDGGDVFVVATGLLSKLARDPAGFALLVVMPNGDTTFVLQNPRVYGLMAVQDEPTLDVYTGPLEIIDSAAFGSMPAFQVRPESYTLDFYPGQAGAGTPRPSDPPLATANLPGLAAGQQYLAVGAGKIDAATSTFQLFVVPEAFDLADATKARLRVLHASDDAPTLDFGTVTVPGTLVSPPLFPNLAYGQVSAAAGASLPTGSPTLGAAATGTTATTAEFGLTTAAGERAFAVAVGEPGDATHPLQIVVIRTESTPWTKSIVPAD